MSDACRDCLRCGEWTPEGPHAVVTAGDARVPDEACTQCGHPLSWHALAGEAIPDEPWFDETSWPDADLH